MSEQAHSFRLPFRVLAEVTFHYNAAKLRYLFQVIRALSEYPIEMLDVVVVTNVADESKLRKISSLCQPLFRPHPWRPDSTKSLAFASFPKLADPWHLPWSHKRLISEKFLSPDANYTHYIHLEEDILLSFDNFCYFANYRDVLAPHRLIPSFQRIEFNYDDNRLYVVDQVGVSDFEDRKSVEVGEYCFVNPDYPHNGLFVLDRELAREYVHTRSFDIERSRGVKPQWGLCERAAMGLCFENPGQGFVSRYAIPVDSHTREIPYWSWVYHVSNKYTTYRMTRYGKTEPDKVFCGDPQLVQWSPPTSLERVVRKTNRLLKRIAHGAPAGTGHDLVPRGLCPLCDLSREEASPCCKKRCPMGWR